MDDDDSGHGEHGDHKPPRKPPEATDHRKTHRLLERIERKLDTLATAEDVEGIRSAVSGVAQLLRTESDQLGVALAQIKDEIASLKDQNVDVDLSGLQAAVADLTASADSLRSSADSVEAIPVPPAVDPVTGAPLEFPHPAGFNPNDPSIPGAVNVEPGTEPVELPPTTFPEPVIEHVDPLTGDPIVAPAETVINPQPGTVTIPASQDPPYVAEPAGGSTPPDEPVVYEEPVNP